MMGQKIRDMWLMADVSSMTNTMMNTFLIYEVPSHPLVHDTVIVKRILIYIVDTDPAALKCRAVLHCHTYEAQDSMTHERFLIVGSGKCSCVIGIYDEPVTINSALQHPHFNGCK